ncbi:MAG: MarC family protein [Candidatus Omnitrophica bacterium]|nr:MarC family protein [Candidatus Omnitrophota bacterium]MCM8798619.1 MarC family protein [Candidatus Omnitrophota bacterium]
MLKNILLAFIPLFVAVDAIGLIPIFINLTQKFPLEKRKRIIRQSLSTAFFVATGFLFLGKFIFSLLGITISDFLIAGGVLLFILAINDLLAHKEKVSFSSDTLGVVPIGVPLIVGPAVLTTSLIIVHTYGLFPTLISLTINILLTGFVFSFSLQIINFLGEGGTKALSKITSLLLAGIAVMLVRKGFLMIFNYKPF